MSEDWCTIESDPGVFTQLCEEVGVKGVQFEEIADLTPGAFMTYDAKQIYGLVFLFKWQSSGDTRPTVDAADNGIFFAQQVIQNACATQAILSVLMNADDKLDLGPHLKEFKEFTGALDPQMKGLAVGNSPVIRKAHNSFRQHTSFEIEQDKDSKGEDAFHFVGYVNVGGKVYELDGLKPGPILIGDAPEGPCAWAERAAEEVKRRIETYSQQAGAEGSSGELRFQLMAVVNSKIHEVETKIDRERFLRQRANISLVSQGEDVGELPDELIDDDDAPADIPTFEDLSVKPLDELKGIVAQCSANIEELSSQIADEKKKRQKWEKENALRRSDLVPLAFCAMRHLAAKGLLMPAFEKGKAEHLKRVEASKAAKA
mmetsp:Transcript_46255/g.99039  ORF Transcript_46255/g.99039 Transcript_46255/m.99039 type:complete len:373 (-) Transcript_46255:77-1195(-)|eukprot:CAMPEP_0206474178 /NCGR_PEP_ID=MMETSP0324_2-20121206/33321_1 /ASSEMBLY_ACC=CAM_ASM_000836 /TAXON_ID=2866 /ORGANISM="Crypthecodinium cohnii, Strain Seligo" /LENGTH=372 /DNA_ID=CAMNT_0053949279 /DNA_START=96 /DNA_END=1214 /DNA_ORIENTATION=+